ncbi:hypothetical protein COL922a_013483 [Colletotrichum nupharicola]|nr:hypothetical protein COL922a_013483 [Colletotrichum nupharicola]
MDTNRGVEGPRRPEISGRDNAFASVDSTGWALAKSSPGTLLGDDGPLHPLNLPARSFNASVDILWVKQREETAQLIAKQQPLPQQIEELDEAGEVAGGELAHEREESNVNINSILSHDDDKTEVGDSNPSLGGCVEYVRLHGQGQYSHPLI